MQKPHRLTMRQMDKETDIQRNIQTNRQTDGVMQRHTMDWRAIKQTHRQIDIPDKMTNR